MRLIIWTLVAIIALWQISVQAVAIFRKEAIQESNKERTKAAREAKANQTIDSQNNFNQDGKESK